MAKADVPTEEEWKKAKAFFRKHRVKAFFKRHPEEGVKFSAKNPKNGVEHSFRMINGQLLATQEKIGEGGIAKIRKGINEKGEKFAIRVEPVTADANKDEASIMQELKYSHGEAVRKVEKGKKFKGQPIEAKKYTAMKLIEGKELFAGYLDPLTGEKLSDKDKLSLGLAAAKAIGELHEKGILHCDIKAENFMVKRETDGSWTVTPIDFGFAKRLPEGANHVKSKDPRGTPGFMAKEVYRESTYSSASDIYALGIMYKVQMGIEHPIVEQMLSEDPAKRPSLKDVENALSIQLAQTPPEQKEIDLDTLIKDYANLNEHDKKKLMLRLSRVDFENKEFVDKLDLKTIQAIKTDVTEFIDAEKQPIMFDFYKVVLVNADHLSKTKSKAQNPEQALEQEMQNAEAVKPVQAQEAAVIPSVSPKRNVEERKENVSNFLKLLKQTNEEQYTKLVNDPVNNIRFLNPQIREDISEIAKEQGTKKREVVREIASDIKKEESEDAAQLAEINSVFPEAKSSSDAIKQPPLEKQPTAYVDMPSMNKTPPLEKQPTAYVDMPSMNKTPPLERQPTAYVNMPPLPINDQQPIHSYKSGVDVLKQLESGIQERKTLKKQDSEPHMEAMPVRDADKEDKFLGPMPVRDEDQKDRLFEPTLVITHAKNLQHEQKKQPEEQKPSDNSELTVSKPSLK